MTTVLLVGLVAGSASTRGNISASGDHKVSVLAENGPVSRKKRDAVSIIDICFERYAMASPAAVAMTPV